MGKHRHHHGSTDCLDLALLPLGSQICRLGMVLNMRCASTREEYFVDPPYPEQAPNHRVAWHLTGVVI